MSSPQKQDTASPLAYIRNVTKQFSVNDGVKALDDISAEIPKGKIIGLIGPDGAGKTTLIRLMTGLMLPTSGTITVAGLNTVTQAEELHRIIGYMPQKFGLYEELSVIQNLNLYADLKGVVGEERSATYEKLLHFTNLKPFLNRLAGDLSGGMKQKLGLACALVKKPVILLLDEPSVGVDPISRRELWAMVGDLIQEGISVLWSTAYLDEADKCHSVLLLNEGKLLFNGAPEQLTETVTGRSFLITNIEGRKRQVLEDALKSPGVIDGVIQGENVRIVLKSKATPFPSPTELNAGHEFKIIPAPPRFEDAFIDILGGIPNSESILAAKTAPIQNVEESIIKAFSLTKKYGNFTAAKEISFEIKKGEIFGLLGPNGAGKSTTFKMLCGLLKPTQGEAFVNGFNLQTAPGKARSQIGYMAQKFSLYGNLSVKQNLDFFSGIYNLPSQKRKNSIDEMIEIFSLHPYLNESAELLPLGFKQRLALASALMHQPPVLFLDEPTSGVDPLTRREFWSHINGLIEKGVTIMVTTHFMDEAEYCDRIALIYKSQIIQSGTPDQLKELAKTKENENPTLEDAFIFLIEEHDRRQQ